MGSGLSSQPSPCPRHPPCGGGCGGVTVCAARAVTPLLVLPWPGLGWVRAWPGFWTRDTPKKPTPGGRSLLTPELSDGGGIANAKPPREFPFWKVGSSPFMTFSRGGGGGTGWAYGSDTICVMTSAPTRPLSNVNSWEGPGRQAAKAVGPGGDGGWEWAGWSGDPLHWLREARECPSRRLAGLEPLGSQVPGKPCPLPAGPSLLTPQGADRGGFPPPSWYGLGGTSPPLAAPSVDASQAP